MTVLTGLCHTTAYDSQAMARSEEQALPPLW